MPANPVRVACGRVAGPAAEERDLELAEAWAGKG